MKYANIFEFKICPKDSFRGIRTCGLKLKSHADNATKSDYNGSLVPKLNLGTIIHELWLLFHEILQIFIQNQTGFRKDGKLTGQRYR